MMKFVYHFLGITITHLLVFQHGVYIDAQAPSDIPSSVPTTSFIPPENMPPPHILRQLICTQQSNASSLDGLCRDCQFNQSECTCDKQVILCQFLLVQKEIKCIEEQSLTFKTTSLSNICTNCDIDAVNCNCTKITNICKIKFNETSPILLEYLDCTIHETVDKIKAWFNIIFGVVGLIGNLAVIVITLTYYKKSSRCHFLIAGLAVTDFIFSIVALVLHIPNVWTCDWLYGWGACKVLLSSGNLSYMVALGFILLIAVERYTGIVHPFSRWLTNKVLWALIAANIAIGIGTTMPSTVYTKLKRKEENKHICEEEWPNKTVPIFYSWLLFVLYFLIPVLVILFLYYKILITLRDSASNHGTSANDRQTEQRLKNNRRIMKILCGILIAFVVLVFPNRITWLIIDHIRINNLSKSGKDGLTIFGFIPYSIHTAINPILYSIIDKKFRRRIKELFCPTSREPKSMYDTKSSSVNEHSTPDVELKTCRQISIDSLVE